MTIAATYLTSEGVVLGADSTATISNPIGVVQLLDHAQKVFEIGQESRIGLCCWGAAGYAQVSHRTLAARLSEQPGFATFTVEQAAHSFVPLVMAARGAAQVTDLAGYFVGGWNLETHHPQCFRILFQHGQNPTVEQLQIGDARFEGVPNFFTRAFHGLDPELPLRIRNALAEQFWLQQQQPLPADFDARFDQAFRDAVAPLAAVGHRDIPIREAIDFIYSYIHITIKAHKFRFGPPSCGGPIELGFITTDRTFRWALHKSFQTAMFEQEPTREYE